MLLLDLVALEREHLVGITVGLQVEDVFCSSALTPFYLTDQFLRLGHPHLSGIAEM